MLLSGEAHVIHFLLTDAQKDEFGLMFGAMIIAFALLSAFVVVGHVIHDWWRKRHG